MSDALKYAENGGRYTYADYEKFPADVRYELIDGEAYMMSSPMLWHQRIIRSFGTQLDLWFSGKECEYIPAPFDVRLFPKDDNSDDTVVQPDLMVVCGKDKLSDGRTCRGAPDFIIEVLSPSTRSRDLIAKRDKYEKAGVREYWIVSQDIIRQYVLADGKYAESVHIIGTEPIEVSSHLFEGLFLRLDPELA